MVFESRVKWATSVPILVFLGLSVLDLGPGTRETDVRHASSLNALALWGRGHNKFSESHLSRPRLRCDAGFCQSIKEKMTNCHFHYYITMTQLFCLHTRAEKERALSVHLGTFVARHLVNGGGRDTTNGVAQRI